MHPARRNFRAVWLSLFTTAMGLMAFLPMLALYVGERFAIGDAHEIALWASIIYGAGPLSAACMGPVWGVMGDRYGKRRMAVRANLAIAATTALMPLAPTPLWLLVARIAQGLFAGYVAPAMALCTGVLPRYVHGRVIARLQVAMALGSFVGPVVGAEATALFGRASLFWIASAMSLLSAMHLWIASVEVAPAGTGPRVSFLQDFRRGLATLLGNRTFAWLLVLLLVLRLGQNMLEPLLSLFVRDHGPASLLAAVSDSRAAAIDRTVAVAFGVLAVGQWVCTPWWGRMADRRGPLRCLVVLSFGLGGVFLVMATIDSVDAFLLLRVAQAALMAGSLTLAYAAVSKRVHDGHRTLAFSLVQSGIQFGLAGGPMLGSLVAEVDGGAVDYSRTFLLAAGLCCAAACGMVWLRRVEARSSPSP